MKANTRLALALALTLATCTDDVPEPTDLGTLDTGDAAVDTGPDLGDADATDADSGDTGNPDAEPPECEPAASDYSPGADDEWPECISDDGVYHQFQESISTIGRVGGFEEIADLLWRNGSPNPAAFVAARDVYATGEGLDSRVQRREDEHYPPVTDSDTGDVLRCRDEGVPAMDPERCVGPALILPILNGAFQAGIEGTDPDVQAARIEAALLWFLYVSTHKEASTCALASKDCDSAYAYYSGGEDRSGGLGLAGVVREIAPDTHDRVWDAILAVRCWRDLDSGEEATDLEVRDRAVWQLDTALLHGLARIVADRYESWADSGSDADAAFVEILGGVLDRAATEIDPILADDLAQAIASGEGDVDIAMSGIFPCP
jgi:hypothetical protein